MNPKNATLWIGLIIGILLVTTVIKIYSSAHDEFRLAEQLAGEKKYAEAVPHYERAIHWYLPGLDVTDRAAAGLWRIAEAHEAAGEPQQALDAYRLLRSAFYSTRSVFTPGKHWIAKCNEKIAALMAKAPPSSPSEQELTFEQRKAQNLSRLSEERSPRPGWAVLAEVGFFGWVLCAVLFIVLAVTKSGALKPRPGWALTGGFVVFYALWIWGLFRV